MKLSTVSSLVLSLLPLASALPASTATPDLAAAELSFEQLTEKALNATLAQLEVQEAKLKKRGETASCTVRNLSIRREYSTLTKKERKNYIDAVLCLQKKPANTPSNVSSGARSRFDDFVVTHIQQTLGIHYTGNFLAWHRYYIYIYEKVLREECGFTGSLPYWEWSATIDAPQNSTLFNGDDYSLSGNGEFIPGHKGPSLLPAFPAPGDIPIQLDAGLGGGCVTTGPFKNYTVNLGPVSVQDVAPGPEGGLGYNPRCLRRDIGPGVLTKYNNWAAVLKTINKKTIEEFQWELQGKPGSNTIGPHGGGHYTIGGDPGGDLFVSPADPAFYQHHGQIDRLWTVWQALGPERTYALSGTNTFMNVPPSKNTTLDDTINVGYAGGASSITIQELMSTTAGPFCYIYL